MFTFRFIILVKIQYNKLNILIEKFPSLKGGVESAQRVPIAIGSVTSKYFF